MSSSNDQAAMHVSDALGTVPASSAPSEATSAPVSHDASALDDMVRVRLSETLSTVGESADPVAELESAIVTVAGQLGDLHHSGAGRPTQPGGHAEIEKAIGTLVNVALEMDDPVRGLEEGANSLAEALAARDLAAHEHLQAAHERQIDEHAAYRHARFHRVAELLDVGYSLDQAIAITNANETDIRARAAATGRNPMEPIYQYAVLNGYRSSRPARSSLPGGGRVARRPSSGDGPSVLEALAGLDETAFAEATKGDRWQTLMQR